MESSRAGDMRRISLAMKIMALVSILLPNIVHGEPLREALSVGTTTSAGAPIISDVKIVGEKGNETSQAAVLSAGIDAPIDETANAAESAVHGPVKIIVIDPGHGGTNEGAIGIAGIYEKKLTLQVAQLLVDRLRQALPDVEIVMTRHRDENVSLLERIDIANRLKADLFVSLHYNSSTNPEAIGFESFWVGDFWEGDMLRDGIEITDEIRSQRTQSGLLGQQMAHYFNQAMRHRFDVLDRGVKPGNYTVLTQARVPAVVLEMAFLSHAQEGISTVYANHRKKIVDALAESIIRYSKNGNL